jgi:hypothetical protein
MSAAGVAQARRARRRAKASEADAPAMTWHLGGKEAEA